MADRRCSNCGDTPVRAKGRCVRCVKWLYRHGTDRPADVCLAYFNKLDEKAQRAGRTWWVRAHA